MDVMDGVELMRANGLRRLVVVDEDGRLAGIATMEDLLELLANELSALTLALRGARDREFEQRR
jgi:CBS domain-containing protein